MILNIRGTSGSGKSTAVREFMKSLGEFGSILQDARTIGYQLHGIAVVGRYESPCGGCDTIKTMQEIVDRVSLFASMFEHVVFEGLMLSGDRNYTTKLFDKFRQRIIFGFMDTPLDLCLRQVQKRRQARGETKPFNPEGTTARFRSIQRSFANLKAAGMDCRWIDHREPTAQMREWIGVKP